MPERDAKLEVETATPPDELTAAEMTAETVELERYYTPDELFTMPLDALEELWQSAPDRGFYETALEQAVAAYGGDGSPDESQDLTRLAVIRRCLELYGETPPQVPAITLPDGEIVWFKVPDRILRGLRAGQPPAQPGGTQTLPRLTPRRVILAATVVLAVGCVLVTLLQRGASERPDAAALTATAGVQVAQGIAPGPTPTSTPLALENLDRPIRAGEDLGGIYPVLLEISPAERAARVFPVQQKEVRVAEWQYDSDPDVASSVLGLAIQPVLGIPYTLDNAAFLEALQSGDALSLRMSTGQTRHYVITDSERVDRQAVSIFDQHNPGIAITLLGEPAGDRLVVHGLYLALQETTGEPLPTQTSIDLGQPGTDPATGTTLMVLGTTLTAGSEQAPLPAGWTYLVVELSIRPSGDLTAGELDFQLVDAAGGRYVPVAAGEALGDFPPLGQQRLAADTDTQASLAFLVPSGTSESALLASVRQGEPLRFSLDAPADSGLTAGDLNVRVVELVTTGTSDRPGDLLVSVRVYNPHSQTLSLGEEDVNVVYSPVPPGDRFPVGPSTSPEGASLPLTVQPGSALDFELRFPWSGDHYVGLDLAGHRYLSQLRE